MNNKVKAGLAVGGAAVLLSGIGGSLAFWSEDLPVGGTSITGGRLDITTDGTHPGCGAWTLDGGEGTTAYTSGDPLVPGDVLTRTCTYLVTAKGNHLRATVAVSSPTFSGTGGNLDGQLTATVDSLTLGGTPVSSFTSADDGKTLNVVVAVRWNAADTLHEGASTALAGLTLSARQVHS